MKTIMERNKQGKTKIEDIEFQVPRGISTLHIIDNNKIINGDNFFEDGWIYNPIKKPRKWFTEIEGIKVWRGKTMKNIIVT